MTPAMTISTYCEFPFNRVKIYDHGRMSMCCHQNPTWSLGNILHSSFDDLWFGSEAEEVRKYCHKNMLAPACDTRECPCRYRNESKNYPPVAINQNGYPTSIELDLHSSHCNYGGSHPTWDKCCIMCPRGHPDFAKQLGRTPDNTYEILDKIKHIVPYLSSIIVVGLAEPFWKNKILEIGAILKLPPTVTWTAFTNGSVFDMTAQRQFASMTKNSIIGFSVDAATSETYVKIRRYNLFDQISTNIREWCKLRRTLPDSNHEIIIHNNINTLNVHEVPQMVRLVKEWGADTLVLLPTHNTGNHPDVKFIVANESNYQQFQDAQDAACVLASELGVKLQITRPLAWRYGRQRLNIKAEPKHL